MIELVYISQGMRIIHVLGKFFFSFSYAYTFVIYVSHIKNAVYAGDR